MKVAELLERRRIHWQELEQLTTRLETLARRRMTSPELTRFATLYRAACADLALADAYQLPPNTVQYLHRLVGRAHNQLYRARKFDLQRWKTMLARDVPQRVSHDRCVQLAFVMFWGIFLGSMWLAYFDRDFAKGIVGEAQLTQMQEMHGRDHDDSGALLSPTSVAFYISHNTGIGLECFAGGVLVLPGIAVTIFNAAQLGAVFGFMARPEVEARSSFYQFVTAHGPFELTAIVLSAGAGLRLGMAWLVTTLSLAERKTSATLGLERDEAVLVPGPLARESSLRRTAVYAMPIMGAAIVMFALAAVIEGMISPWDAIPYAAKLGVAIVSTLMLGFYFLVLGFPRR